MNDISLLIADFKAHLKKLNYSENTIRSYHFHLDKFSKSIAIKNIHQIDEEIIIQYLLKIKNNYSNSYYQSRAKSLRIFFRYLKKLHIIFINPALVIPSIKDPKVLPSSIMNHREVELIMSQTDESTLYGFMFRTLLEVMYSTALRCGEMTNITLYDIRISNRFLTVREGKGGHDRIVPIGKTACQYLEVYIEKVRPKLLKGDNHIFIFVNQLGNPIQSQSIQSQVRKYREQAQLKKKITPHSFRHTCATEMIRGGSSVHHVQELLGHSNIQTTEIYTKLTIVDVVKAHKSAHPRERKRLREEVCFNPLNAKIRFKKALKK